MLNNYNIGRIFRRYIQKIIEFKLKYKLFRYYTFNNSFRIFLFYLLHDKVLITIYR